MSNVITHPRFDRPKVLQVGIALEFDIKRQALVLRVVDELRPAS